MQIVYKMHTTYRALFYDALLSIFCCIGVTCNPLDAPDNGFIRFSSTTVGSVASYSCNPGFELQGVTSRICRPGGEWSEVAPVCIGR